jgi:hypothetical protein
MTPMRSLELDDEDQFDAMPMPVTMDKPKYPYGTRISLSEKEIAKLDCDPAEFVKDGIIHIHGLCRITNVSQTDGEMGKTCRVELQIEDMAIESEDAENEAAEYE